MSKEQQDRAEILKRVRQYYEDHGRKDGPFVPGKTPVPYGGRIYDADEMEALVDAALDFWLTAGPRAREFETRCAALFGLDHSLFVNSGSSALLLAVTALCDRSLGERRLKPGDEVITPAMGFPTTAAPLVRAGIVPVFVDVDPATCNPSADVVRRAVTGKTRGLVLAHAFGNPFDCDAIEEVARENDLWLVEDNCDALGSRFNGRLTGTFGHLSTISFYASHHLTTGEGGAVLTGSEELAGIVRSLRDWGRDCVCPPGKDNSCGKRFLGRHGSLPEGFDHKYVYARPGFNLKATDLQAAIGLAQLDKLDDFTARRKRNFSRLREALSDLSDRLILPEALPGSDPSWFGFPITIRGGGPSRGSVVDGLEKRGIATRMFFAGNMARQPAFEGVSYRISGTLENADRMVHDSFWVGVYPGISDEMCDFVARSIREELDKKEE